MEWLGAVWQGICTAGAWMFQRSTEPADKAILDSMRSELARCVERLRQCEQECGECRADRAKLWSENDRLMRVVALAEGAKLSGRIVINSGATIVSANPAVAAWLGYPLEKLIGMSAVELIDYSERSHAIKLFGEVVAGGRTLGEGSFEFQLLTQSGTLIPVDVHLSSWEYSGAVMYGAEIRWR